MTLFVKLLSLTGGLLDVTLCLSHEDRGVFSREAGPSNSQQSSQAVRSFGEDTCSLIAFTLTPEKPFYLFTMSKSPLTMAVVVVIYLWFCYFESNDLYLDSIYI